MLVLLDIDGVMVPANGWRRPEFLADDFAAFSPAATRALRRLLAETGADVALTTSHKSNHSIAAWREIFSRRGISLGGLSRLPRASSSTTRKDEIVAWSAAAPADTNFVILDDDKGLNDLPPHLKNRLVLTSGGIGLTDDLADEAISLLKATDTPALTAMG